MVYRLLIVSFGLFIIRVSHGQELNVPAANHINKQWRATWISNPDISGNEHAVILFRKNFELSVVPGQFIISISADNKYTLFVNGQKVCFGPQLSDIRHWRYETVDIAKYLNIGKNVMAAEVVNFGPDRFFGMQSYRTALIINRLDTPLNANIDVDTRANNGWKTYWNRSVHEREVRWRSQPKSIIGGFYAANPTDSLVAAEYPWGWHETGYNDASWKSVVFSENASAFGGGFGWLLEPRNTPLQMQRIERIARILSVEGVKSTPNFLTGSGPLTIPANSKLKLLIDNNVLTIGYPHLRFANGSGSKITIGYAENLFEPNSSRKGNRDEWRGKQFVGITDVVIPDGKSHTFYPTWLRSFRFIQFEIETKGEPLVLEDFYNLYTSTPIETVGRFFTDNDVYNKVFHLCERTVRLCTQDYFLSDAYYETMQYVGDTKVHALVWQDLTGNDLHTRNALEQFHYSRLWDGNLTSCYPLRSTFVHPTYSVIWIDMLYDYLRYKGDKSFVAKFVPGIHQTLSMFEELMSSDGLAGATRWNYFVDWYADSKTGGLAPGQDGSNSAVVTLHYVYALQNAARILDVLGDQRKATEYRERASRIKTAVKKLCYDTTRKMFAERPDKSYFDQHTNIMAILTDAIPAEEFEPLLKKILEDKSLGQATYYYRFYLIEALVKAQAPHLFALAQEPWEQLVADGLSTALERFESPSKPTRSECHPWSTGPVYGHFRLLAGIRPSDTVTNSVKIQPYLGNLSYIEGTYPHPLGSIGFNFKKSDQGITGFVELPASMTGTLVVNGKTIQLKAGKNMIP